MASKRDGFLYKDERDVIDAHAGTPGATVEMLKTNTDGEIQLQEDSLNEELLAKVRDVSDTKYRLHNKAATPDTISEIIQAHRMDLERLKNYYCQVRPQPGGRWYWRDRVLPHIQHEVESLQLLLESWQEAANSTGDETVREELVTAMKPLHRGLDELNERLDAIDEGTADLESESKELKNDKEELRARRAALFELLKREGLLELFEYIADNPGGKLPDETIGDNTWNWWASRMLETKHELVKDITDRAWGYELTDRGELVYEVLSNFEDASLVHMVGEGKMSTAEAALSLLDHHFPVDQWFR
jgi:hypothetical protein